MHSSSQNSKHKKKRGTSLGKFGNRDWMEEGINTHLEKIRKEFVQFQWKLALFQAQGIIWKLSKDLSAACILQPPAVPFWESAVITFCSNKSCRYCLKLFLCECPCSSFTVTILQNLFSLVVNLVTLLNHRNTLAIYYNSFKLGHSTPKYDDVFNYIHYN